MYTGPQIITDGLVFYLDAANPKSYPGSGTNWKDIVINNNGTLTNGPTFSTNGKGSIVFDGVNDYTNVSHNSNLNPETGDFSVCIWAKYNGPALTTTSVIESLISKGVYNVSGSEWELIFRGGSINGLYFRLRTTSSFEEINLSASQITIIEDGNFHMYTVSIEKGATNEGRVYIDNNLVGTKSSITLNISNTDPLYVGRYSSIYGTVQVANQLIYKGKGLTDSEVLQNYNATKQRFK